MNLITCPLDDNILTISMTRRDVEDIVVFYKQLPQPILNGTILRLMDHFEIFIGENQEERQTDSEEILRDFTLSPQGERVWHPNPRFDL